ncbi:unnamed protein product [Arabis nemorensis]|uniref:DUF7795 domain-containing protein n=1 Tax=Arabis nemorensis TaxID=586526 RepID=A0A565BH55_9BRAS|nr:unnamed protein product [Arabis nemorensis]
MLLSSLFNLLPLNLGQIYVAVNRFHLRFHQRLSALLCIIFTLTCFVIVSYEIAISGFLLLQRPPIVTSSKLIEKIIKNNETRWLKSYVAAGCIIHDAAQSTRACFLWLKKLVKGAAGYVEEQPLRIQ